MKAEDVKIGMRVRFFSEGIEEDYGVIISPHVDDGLFWVKWESDGRVLNVSTDEIEPAEEIPTKPPIDLHNCKINVQAYAEQYKISLEEAYSEIQQYLFDNGCLWIGDVTTHSMFGLDKKHLYTRNEKVIRYGSDAHTFDKDTRQEVTFSRRISLTPQLVSPVFVEYNGKKYDKKLFEKAIDGLEAAE